MAVEQYLNSNTFKHAYPETGKDIKIMAFRKNRDLTLTAAIAFVDRYIRDEKMYFEKKQIIQDNLTEFIRCKQQSIENVTVQLNTLDDPERGQDGMYLTVLGTSAENGDGGQVGRGNRVNGLITFNRPQSLEAAAGKNPVNHVGKIYNVLSHEIARRIHKEVNGVREVTVYLCSQIGNPLDEPLQASASLILEEDMHLDDVRKDVALIIQVELAYIGVFMEQLALGKYEIC